MVATLAEAAFTDDAHNVVLVGRPGHGQDAPGNGHRRVGHHPARQARALLLHGRPGQRAGAGEGPGQGRRIAMSLLRMDLVILDDLGYLPFSQAGRALLFHLLRSWRNTLASP